MTDSPPFLDPILYTDEYIHKCLGSCIFFIVAHYIAYFTLANLPGGSIELNEAALARKQDHTKFLREAASCAVGFFYHTLAAPFACWYLVRLVFEAETLPSLIMRDPTLPDDSMAVHVQDQLMLMSEIFIGYMVSLIFFFFLGWEEGLTPLIHHCTFLSICVISANFNFVVGAASLAMEMSSPALNLHLVYRNLAGEQAQKITAASVKYFALLFFIFRIIIYGSAVVWLCYILATQDMPRPLNWGKMGASVVLFVGGLALQLNWLNQIYHKAMRSMAKKKKNKGQQSR